MCHHYANPHSHTFLSLLPSVLLGTENIPFPHDAVSDPETRAAMQERRPVRACGRQSTPRMKTGQASAHWGAGISEQLSGKDPIQKDRSETEVTGEKVELPETHSHTGSYLGDSPHLIAKHCSCYGEEKLNKKSQDTVKLKLTGTRQP